jgi:hypothetical protein
MPRAISVKAAVETEGLLPERSPDVKARLYELYAGLLGKSGHSRSEL